MHTHLDVLHDYRLWLQAANCTPRTVAARVDGARHLLALAEHNPAHVTARHVIAYITSVTAPASRATYYQHAASLHAYLTAHGDTGPFMTGVPRPRMPRGLPRPIDPNELARAILGAQPRPAMMLRLAAFAGLRVSEIANVRGEDVGVSIYVHGKGGRVDMLPTHPCITAAALTFPERGWWFANRAGEPMTRISVWRHMTLALRAIGSAATPHQCRHLYGTALLESGADLRTVQRLLRHADLSTTAVYTRVTDARLRAAVVNLPTVEIPEGPSMPVPFP